MDLTNSTWHAIRPSRRSPRHAATRRVDRLPRACRQSCAGAVVSIGTALVLLAPAHTAAAASSTAQLFSSTCAGMMQCLAVSTSSLCRQGGQLTSETLAACHAGGGNIVQRNAGLRLDELIRNDAAKPEQIYSLIYSGKGKMPGYGKDCAPKASMFADGCMFHIADGCMFHVPQQPSQVRSCCVGEVHVCC